MIKIDAGGYTRVMIDLDKVLSCVVRRTGREYKVSIMLDGAHKEIEIVTFDEKVVDEILGHIENGGEIQWTLNQS